MDGQAARHAKGARRGYLVSESLRIRPQWKAPAGVGGDGAGASIFGTAAITLSCAPFRTVGLGFAATAKRMFGVPNSNIEKVVESAQAT
jgi:hypothetical protein